MCKKKRTLWSVLKDYYFLKVICHTIFFPIRFDNGEFCSYYAIFLYGPRLYYKFFFL